MASRVVVHIGLQKSGTTYLQKILQQLAGELAAAGVSYPLPPASKLPAAQERRRSEFNHERITYGLLGPEYHWVPERRKEQARGRWQWLVRQVRAHSGTVLLSAEALSVIRSQGIHRLVEELGGDIDVVVTARDLGRILPSAWQQHIRNGRLSSFGQYLRDLADQRDRPLEDREDIPELHFWRAFAFGGLVRRWAKVVGSDRIQVVTNPRGAPTEQLWSRFCQAAGIPADAVSPPEQVLKQRTHAGLSAPEAAVLASLNTTLDRAGWEHRAALALREHIIANGFAPSTERGPRIVVPEGWRDRVAGWSEEDVGQLADTGVVVLGDVDDLRYDPRHDDVPAPSPEDVARSAAVAVLSASNAPRGGAADPRGNTDDPPTASAGRRDGAGEPTGPTGPPGPTGPVAKSPGPTGPVAKSPGRYRRAARWMRKRARSIR